MGELTLPPVESCDGEALPALRARRMAKVGAGGRRAGWPAGQLQGCMTLLLFPPSPPAVLLLRRLRLPALVLGHQCVALLPRLLAPARPCGRQVCVGGRGREGQGGSCFNSRECAPLCGAGSTCSASSRRPHCPAPLPPPADARRSALGFAVYTCLFLPWFLLYLIGGRRSACMNALACDTRLLDQSLEATQSPPTAPRPCPASTPCRRSGR